MTETNKQPTTEAGRSMVEMLGVLAVIGVLSIGGIAGYNLGIEKQRAYTVSAQLLTGRNASLVEFNQDTRKAGGTFLSDADTEYLGEIGIKITGVNQNICKALVRSMTDNSPLRGIVVTGEQTNITEEDCQESNDLTLYYNDSMSLSENLNTEDICGSNGEPKCKGECCPAGHTCDRGDNGVDYGCISVQSDSECLSNAECGENEYCHVTATRDGTLASHYKDIQGICKSNVGVIYPTIDENTTNIVRNSLLSSENMKWWGAKNFCESHGKVLLSVDDFECTSLTNGDYGRCFRKGTG